MPVFQPRARPEILREMIARVVARSTLTGITRNNGLFHVLAAASSEDAEQYFQMARLRDLFSIDKATGSDLDARAKEIVPGTLPRRAPIQAAGTVVFSRPGTSGTTAIPSGTLVAATDARGQISYQTTAVGSILNTFTDSAPVNISAIEAGARANVAAGSINQFISRVAGIPVVSNTSAVTSGQDRESDASFRARLRAFIQAMSRGTVTAIEAFATEVILSTGQRVIFANVKEPVIPTGSINLYIDDGTGNVETFDSSLIGSPEVLIAVAVGDEVEAFTTNKPIRDDGTLVVRRDPGGGYVTLVRGTDYDIDVTSGRISFLVSVTLPLGSLTAGDAINAEYRYYTGLIQETQKVVNGDPLNPLVYPGVRPAGIQVPVLSPSLLSQALTGTISVLSGFDTLAVAVNVSTAIQEYINQLPIGANVIVSEIIERAMGVDGMFNFAIQALTGSAPATDQIILDDQVARITAANITLV